METIISENIFSSVEGTAIVKLLSFSSGKELWIHSEEPFITLKMEEARRLRDYINSIDLRETKHSNNKAHGIATTVRPKIKTL